ncbi:hypothetical protein V502_07539 [Pseudogymnoascus sp. VKM F-4520 (FW-2644)]|nr:hypothetical protein V502_07539 [Pseudogymnoascus sp. VKM F-4520 (FW-2644)]
MFNKAAVTRGSGGSRCTLIRPWFGKQKSGEGCVAPLSFEESFSKIVLKIYGFAGRDTEHGMILVVGALCILPPRSERMVQASPVNYYARRNEINLAAYAIDNAQVQAWLHQAGHLSEPWLTTKIGTLAELSATAPVVCCHVQKTIQ